MTTQGGTAFAGTREAWLAETREPALEPDLPICDPHHHLWDRRGGHRYMLPDLVADCAEGHRIESTVFIECRSFYRAAGPVAMRPIGETEFVNGAAAMSASGAYGGTRACAGIVGHADLRLGAAVEAVLAAHVAAGNGRFRGIRHSASWDASDAIHDNHTGSPGDVYSDPNFREGFGRLAAHGLTFEAWLYHPQLQEVADLAAAFPDQPIVLNHVGGPLGAGPYAGRRDAVFADWKAGIERVAAHPNVHVKLGGLGMKICGFDFHTRDRAPSSEDLAAAWRPFVETAIEAFGPERAMFESNFPVDKESCGYANLWNAFKRIAAGASAEEKAALFHDTATRFYRLA
ncbi:L-fuconolactonase [Constrictibacter sp. MBR-5]|uniref:amidohydrolase family protein n=1 Tax=Constrictibacter sp. MBR-5 TaxID=3156467 RepID=UPI003395F707